MKRLENEESTCLTWLSRNWVLLALIAVGLSGLGIALALFITPCPRVLVETIELRNETIQVPINVSQTEVSPVASFVSFDGSGSTRNFFQTELSAAQTLLRTLRSTLTSFGDLVNITDSSDLTLVAGAGQWSNIVPTIVSPLTSNLEDALDRIGSTEHLGGGTALGTGTALCGNEFYSENAELDRPGIQRICVLVSDGQTYDVNIEYVQVDPIVDEDFYRQDCLDNPSTACNSRPSTSAGNVVAEFCGKVTPPISPCTLTNIHTRFRSDGIFVAGLFVGNDLNGLEQLYQTTRCPELQTFNREQALECPFFASAADPNQLAETANELAVTLVTEVTISSFVNQTLSNETLVVEDITTEFVCTTEPIYFFFLIMFIPLGLYLFWRPISLFLSKYCCPPKPTPPAAAKLAEEPLYVSPARESVPVFESSRVPSLAPIPVTIPARAPVAEAFTPPPAAPAPEPNTLVKSKRYRWSIKAADAYLWNLGASGVAPLNVNFNGMAPPSAPKQEATEENMKRKTQRISLRWSYVAPALGDSGTPRSSVRSGRISQRVSSLAAAVMPSWEPPERLEPFNEDEIQPGDIDYEYTMCLMRFCPCLRPSQSALNTDRKKGFHMKAGGGSGSDSSLDGIEHRSTGPEGQFFNPQFGNVPSSENWNRESGTSNQSWNAPNNTNNQSWNAPNSTNNQSWNEPNSTNNQSWNEPNTTSNRNLSDGESWKQTNGSNWDMTIEEDAESEEEYIEVEHDPEPDTGYFAGNNNHVWKDVPESIDEFV